MSQFGQKPPFREDDLDDGLAFVVQELQARGHWRAEAEVVRRSTSPTGSIDLTIDVDQGPLFRIGRPTVTSSVSEMARGAVAAADRFIGQPF